MYRSDQRYDNTVLIQAGLDECFFYLQYRQQYNILLKLYTPIIEIIEIIEIIILKLSKLIIINK